MRDPLPAPLQFKGVMISSTFTDLKEHRSALIRAIKGHGLTDVAMENDSARADADVIDSSLRMVADGSAYIAILSHRYGQVPKCRRRNPGNVSITELEFNEAQRLNRPILLFIMGKGHPVTEADVETNTTKRKKMKAFIERAKKSTDSSVHRVYSTYNSLEEFTQQVYQSVANLRRYLDGPTTISPQQEQQIEVNTIPAPPAFYAEPPYIGSHDFLGRRAELERLNDWASPADSHPIILFEAIGGTGKSLLTWEWTRKHSTNIRDDWAGRFWYSFYEKGAIMADFCRRALAYITGQPLEVFQKQKTRELSDMLLRHLQERPWLFVLDGLERVLVAYHRFDAAQVIDEEAGASDQIAKRDPRAAIRPEDDDLLRALAAASPSKLIISSRLVPRALLNSASQRIPGVARVLLLGLRPADAEALIRACGVSGNSQDIQHYLTRHCDCHPLVTGVLAGLINDYLPDRGNFDSWAVDPDYGGQLNLAELDLVQKRNHILHTALAALSEKSRQLLSALALLSEAIDYPALSALNPHLPPEPEVVEVPLPPENHWQWGNWSDEERQDAQQDYEQGLERLNEYEQAVRDRLRSPEFLSAPHELTDTVRDLERRGLLQYDAHTKRHDLHPVVRGIAAGGLQPNEREYYGQRLVDHFSRQAHNPYEQAETLDDVRSGLHLVRTLLHMGRYKQACDAYLGDLYVALVSNLEAYAEILSLIRPFFSKNWEILPNDLNNSEGLNLLNSAATHLAETGESTEALRVYGSAMVSQIELREWGYMRLLMTNICTVLADLHSLAKYDRCSLLSIDLASLIDDNEDLFRARLARFDYLVTVGRSKEAEGMWQLLDPMGRDWRRSIYRPGNAETSCVWYHFEEGTLTERDLCKAEDLARSGRNRSRIRSLHRLRGEWNIQNGHWSAAVESFGEAIQMARAVGQSASSSEAKLALAKFQLGLLSNPRQEAEQLSIAPDVDHQAVGELWLALGYPVEAKKHALGAYKWAWADGEPYVRRYYLNRALDLLNRLGVEAPNLPPYDPSRDEKLPWEDDLMGAIEKLREEKQAESLDEDE